MRVNRFSSNDDILVVLHRVSDAVHEVLAANDDWGLSGRRATQYSIDVKVDEAALAVLHAAGCAVLSEESERTGEWGPDDILVVMDPLDGSSNASRRVPWYATALAAIDHDGQRASLVVNQATGTDRWWAVTGGGAFRNGTALSPRTSRALNESVIGVSGTPLFHPGWAQFRAMGAAALDLCLVAEGALDGWIDYNSHGVWDYLASTHICAEAGVHVTEWQGRSLVVTNHSDRRTPIVASSPDILLRLTDVRDRHEVVRKQATT